MAKNDDTITIPSREVKVSELGVSTRHHLLMDTDQDYRDACLTPPGGYAPGEHGKDPDPVPGEPRQTVVLPV
jgi:hypothetical protein